MSDQSGPSHRRVLAVLGAGVGLLGAGLLAGSLWLSRIAPLDGDLRLVAGLLALALLLMTLRCGRLAWPARDERAGG